jgi:hypothetical protein
MRWWHCKWDLEAHSSLRERTKGMVIVSTSPLGARSVKSRSGNLYGFIEMAQFIPMYKGISFLKKYSCSIQQFCLHWLILQLLVNRNDAFRRHDFVLINSSFRKRKYHHLIPDLNATQSCVHTRTCFLHLFDNALHTKVTFGPRFVLFSVWVDSVWERGNRKARVLRVYIFKFPEILTSDERWEKRVVSAVPGLEQSIVYARHYFFYFELRIR